MDTVTRAPVAPAVVPAIDWRRKMSDHIAYALLTYTALQIFVTIGALKKTSTHLSSAQLGITLTTLLTGYTMEPAISIR